MPNRNPVKRRFTSGEGGGGGFNLGTAYGAVIIDVSGVASAMQQAQTLIGNGLAGVGDRISAMGDMMGRLGGAISTFSAPLAAAGGVGLKAAADFDGLMKQIEIFGNVAPAQLDTVRQYALKMGADTKFSSSDAAAAMLDLLKAGQSLDEAMQTLPEVLNLAAVGNMNLSKASGIVTASLAIFKLGANDAARVSNALARAANASQADVGDLGLALTNVGPIAEMFNLSVEDTSAILGVFANNGINGAEAGTQLKSMLLNLSRPTNDVQAAFNRLGVSLYDAQGNSRNFNTVLKELDAALDKLPVEEQNELMQTLGGSYGIIGLGALRAAGGIDTMLASMAAAPDAGSVATSFMDTFTGETESLLGSLETLMISGLTPFMNNFLSPIVSRLTAVVNGITDWVNANPELTSQIVKVLAVVAALGPSLLVAGKAVSAIGTIISVATGPVGLIGAALYGLFLAFQNNFLGIRDFVEPILASISSAFSYLFEVISGGENGLLGAGGLANLFVVFEDGSSFIGTFLEKLGMSEQAANSFAQGLIGALNAVGGFIQNTLLPTLATLADWFLTQALPTVITFVQNVALPGLQAFFKVLGDVWSVVGPALGQLFDWFVNTALPAVVGFIQNTVIPGVQRFIDILVKVWNDVSPFLTNLANWWLNEVLPTIIHYIEDVAVPMVQTFIDILASIWRLVEPVLTDLYNWFISEGLPAIQSALQTVHDNFIQPFVDILAGIMVTVGPILNALKEWFVTTGLPEIQRFIQSAMDNYITPLINLLSGLWNAVKPGVEGIYNWFRDTFSKIGQFIQPIIDLVNDVINKALTALDQLRQLGGGAPGQSASAIVQKGLPPNMQAGVNFGGMKDVGGAGLAGVAYQIGAGQLRNEVYIPGADGQFVAGFVDLMKSVAAGVNGQGQPVTIQVQMPDAALANPGAARQIGQDFGGAIMDEMERRGFKGVF